MERQYVESSLATEVGYDASTSILEMTFRSNGAVWEYDGVPENLYYDMMNSGSIGSYFLRNIKGQYTERQVG
jgi:hypothetical protein